MARPTATPPLAFLLATAAVLSAGCFDTSSSITNTPYPTRLTIDPVSFRGMVSCGAPGLERYVVTLYNVTSGAPAEKKMTSSGPVACSNFVSFGDTFVLSANFYTAAIDGYDREVTSMGGDFLNGIKPTILDPSTGEEVLPKWTTTCGEVESFDAGPDALEDGAPPYNRLRFPTLALGTAEVIMHGCLPLAAAPMVDASTGDGATGDGATGGEDASTDVVDVPDASADAMDGADTDVTEPDGTGPSEDGGGDGTADGGAEDGGTDGGAGDGESDGGPDDAGIDASAATLGTAKQRGSRSR